MFGKLFETREFGSFEVDNILEKYMMSYVVRLDFWKLKPLALEILDKHIGEVAPTWNETRKFLREVCTQSGHHKTYFSYSDMKCILGQGADRYELAGHRVP